MLTVEEQGRATLEQVLAHPWMQHAPPEPMCCSPEPAQRRPTPLPPCLVKQVLKGAASAGGTDWMAVDVLTEASVVVEACEGGVRVAVQAIV